MLANITSYKGRLVIELLERSSTDECVTSLDTPGVFGQVIMNTDKNLGVSSEAVDLMKKVKAGHDSIGEIDWFSSAKGDTFGWIGGPFTIVDPTTAETARNFSIRSYQPIDNVVPAGAMAAIDSM